ncbi:MAG TPA: hypothetical protein VN938_10650 [Xanthobacteraceae bacterium]|jgi:hypothetical protein|nr:hypothetical protein [Xanthobacteraceae bacterium]
MRGLSQFCDRNEWRQNTHSGRGICRRGSPVIAMLLLAGCSLAPVIAENTLDYNTAVETVTNGVLVSNILRARDGAPLYFSDLSQIRGAVQLSLQAQTTLPYGPAFPAAAGASAQGGPLAVSSQPGFDVAPLNTKKFAEGMLEGIDVKVFAYFIQRHIDPKVFLNLVVSRVELYRKSDKNLVRTCTAEFQKNGTSCVAEVIASWTADGAIAPRIGELPEKDDVGPPIPAELFSKQNNVVASLVQSDAANIDVKKSGDSYQLSKSSVKYVLCVAAGPHRGYIAVGLASPGATKDPIKPPVPKSNGNCGGPSPDPYRYVIYIRSVEAVFYYLGILLNTEQPPIPFHIYDHPVDEARFHTDYRGRSYFVREAATGDPTITILAILNDLLNLNRDAEEIPSTKTVATAP